MTKTLILTVLKSNDILGTHNILLLLYHTVITGTCQKHLIELTTFKNQIPILDMIHCKNR